MVQSYLTDDALLGLLASNPAEHENGPSVLESTMRCARRVRLDAEQSAVGADMGSSDVLTASSEARNIGTITHKLMELHHLGHDVTAYVPREHPHPALSSQLDEAWRLFDRYVAAFPAAFWGELVAAEVRLQGALGGQLLSGRIDAIWNMDAETVARVENRFACALNGPGRYLWDLKTATAKDSNLVAKWEWHPAPFQYLFLDGANDPRGMIFFQGVRLVSKSKVEPFQAACLPADMVLSVDGQRRFEGMLKRAETARLNDEANCRACYDWYRICNHKQTGACQGY